MYKLFFIVMAISSINVVVSNDDSIAGHLFFNSLDEWISRINQTLSRDHRIIGQTCLDDLTLLINSGKDRSPWALRIFDSFGKPGSGIMEASLSFLGFYSECVESFSPSKSFRGKYCNANMKLPNSALTALQKFAGLSTNSLVSPLQPKIGICLPSSCSHDEIQRVASDALSLFITNATLTVTTCSGPTKDVTKDVGAIIVIAIFAGFFLIVLSATLLDYLKNYHNLSDDDNKTSQEYIKQLRVSHSVHNISIPQDESLVSRMRDYLMAFSLIENTKKVLSDERAHLPKSVNNNSEVVKPSTTFDVLNGLRVVMMIWIVVLHSYSFGMQWIFFRNPKELQSAPKHFLSQFFANGTFSVDSFFFISGLLVTNSCMNQMRASNGQLDIIKFYVHRYLRMTPLMMAIIAFSGNLLKYFSEEPSFEESTVMFDSWCHKNWWLNSLYLHNFIHRENMCLGHTWYSAVDMQLYAVAPIILIPLYRRPKVGFLIMAVALIASMSYTAFITITRHLPAIPYLIDIVSQEAITEYYASIYIKPYARAGPYLVGMALGFIFFSKDGKVTLTKKQSIIGWTMSTIANFSVLFAMLPVYAGYTLPDYLAGIYSATSRVIWAVTLGWVTYASCAGHGGIIGSILSAKLWVPWSRLTYAGYLIHPVIMGVFYGSQNASFEFSHLLMTYFVLGNLIITYFLSLILSIVFEAPFVGLEKVFSQRRRRQTLN